jgi:hypothetical protein
VECELDACIIKLSLCIPLQYVHDYFEVVSPPRYSLLCKNKLYITQSIAVVEERELKAQHTHLLLCVCILSMYPEIRMTIGRGISYKFQNI